MYLNTLTKFTKSFTGVISPDIVPITTWSSLWSLNVVHISRRILWSVMWMSIWTWWINVLSFDPEQSQHKSSQLSIQHAGAIK
ncbi:peroxisomal membrane protein [Trifolium repens]|nr:peroxisomal membrane protein [Trifolium repens]